jgi:hypothetical protein
MFSSLQCLIWAAANEFATYKMSQPGQWLVRSRGTLRKRKPRVLIFSRLGLEPFAALAPALPRKSSAKPMKPSPKKPPSPQRQATPNGAGERRAGALNAPEPARRIKAGAPDALVEFSAPAYVSFSNLPPYRMGPYQLRIVAASRGMFRDKRRKVETDWNAGIVHIRRDAKESFALSLVLRHLITAIHYRSGLNDASNEESFTHSCASGLVELALGQREFFARLLTLIEKLVKPGAGWCSAYQKGRALPAPKRIVCGARTCTISFVTSEICNKAQAYGFYTVGNGIIELSDKLSGPSLALIAMHEKLHFLHECAGLRDDSTEAMFKNAQVKLLLSSLKDNPGYWRWWFSLLSRAAS